MGTLSSVRKIKSPRAQANLPLSPGTPARDRVKKKRHFSNDQTDTGQRGHTTILFVENNVISTMTEPSPGEKKSKKSLYDTPNTPNTPDLESQIVILER